MRSRRTVSERANAKVNLTLHVTGRRPDGYHLLDSLVAFADLGDLIEVAEAPAIALKVEGPEARGVPVSPENSVVRAAALIGVTAQIRLEKHLPSAAGIGGGSADAAATLRALSRMAGVPVPEDVIRLGADVPVCMRSELSRMRGIGQVVLPAHLPMLPAVLVNPRKEMTTATVFASMIRRDNPPMPQDLPPIHSTASAIAFIAKQRNDLEPVARSIEPAIAKVLDLMSEHPECGLARMSGSGSTCFALCETRYGAQRLADDMAGVDGSWWVRQVLLS